MEPIMTKCETMLTGMSLWRSLTDDAGGVLVVVGIGETRGVVAGNSRRLVAYWSQMCSHILFMEVEEFLQGHDQILPSGITRFRLDSMAQDPDRE